METVWKLWCVRDGRTALLAYLHITILPGLLRHYLCIVHLGFGRWRNEVGRIISCVCGCGGESWAANPCPARPF